MQPAPITVNLIYRRPRARGTFSMETSFDTMLRHFPADQGVSVRKIVSSYESNGIAPRLRGLLEARKLRADVTHVTGDVHYLVFASPRRSTVLTIHDCGFLNHPNPVLRRALKAVWLDGPVRYCAAVTAVSNATKDDIVRNTGCDPDHVTVIPTVIGTHLRRDARPFPLRRPRVLHVGLAPNKNFFRHVEALAGFDCELRIIGRLEPAHVQALEKARIEYSAVFNLTDAQMQAELASSDLLLFASTLEGFGMPILEAQTVGRPVVTSNCSSMPDIAGGAACLVDPSSAAAIRAGVERVIRDREYRETLVTAGFANTARFDAGTVARQYADLYRRIADRTARLTSRATSARSESGHLRIEE